MGRNLCSEDSQLVSQTQKYVADMYVHITVSRSAAHHKLDRDAQKAASLCRLDMSTAREKIEAKSTDHMITRVGVRFCLPIIPLRNG